ncbi:SMP-30/gluconolactonase/LRE family protein [Nocardioides currus]|uniref:Superoxide dismutase n=1 Tax=Nocardioides currus TaxID=2133958 RepID=A0A2R7Z2R7_9ACTN|nr:SMP-30/gluconolactonase/LRE family protein [Nocardioides currus]PUA82449.1 superoxide dismutase [Nocardioides currus]
MQDRIELPTGWQPEGITADGRKLYVGSLADGRILRANPRNGSVHVLSRSGGTGAPSVGIDYDAKRKVLWVAGGPSGEIRAHSATSGALLARYPLPADAEGRFVNDIVVTRNAVYATDSSNAELGVVRLDGRKVPASAPAEVLPVSGDFVLADGFNLNGIVASDDWLLAVQSATGTLFRIDPATGVAKAVDLGGYQLTNGDGLEPDGDTVYVVRNRDNLIAALELDDDRTAGELVDEITSDDFDVPTTAALLCGSLFAVNARFGNPAPTTADYWIIRVEAD